jgi:hypothetical protein
MIVPRVLPLCLLLAAAHTLPDPAVTASLPALAFSAYVGSESAPQKVTFTNSGNQPLDVHGATLRAGEDANFAVRDDCPSTLQSTQYCTAVVIFRPSQPGPATATLEFADAHTAITGNGIAAKPW